MSVSPTEKTRDPDGSSVDGEDSGHDSVDSLQTGSMNDSGPADVDDRERIASLETAVGWIRQEVVRRRLAIDVVRPC